MKLIDIGYGNVLNESRLIAAVAPESAPVRRVIAAAREKNLLIDASCGKKVKTVYVMDSGHIVLSAKLAAVGEPLHKKEQLS